MAETIIGVFISVFFIFGLYHAVYETGRLILRAVRRKRKKERTIDSEAKKDYNDIK